MTLPEKLRARAAELSHESGMAGNEWTSTLLEQAADEIEDLLAIRERLIELPEDCKPLTEEQAAGALENCSGHEYWECPHVQMAEELKR